eukprot:403376339
MKNKKIPSIIKIKYRLKPKILFSQIKPIRVNRDINEEISKDRLENRIIRWLEKYRGLRLQQNKQELLDKNNDQNWPMSNDSQLLKEREEQKNFDKFDSKKQQKQQIVINVQTNEDDQRSLSDFSDNINDDRFDNSLDKDGIVMKPNFDFDLNLMNLNFETDDKKLSTSKGDENSRNNKNVNYKLQQKSRDSENYYNLKNINKTHNLNTLSIQSNSTYEKVDKELIKNLKRQSKQKQTFREQEQNIEIQDGIIDERNQEQNKKLQLNKTPGSNKILKMQDKKDSAQLVIKSNIKTKKESNDPKLKHIFQEEKNSNHQVQDYEHQITDSDDESQFKENDDSEEDQCDEDINNLKTNQDLLLPSQRKLISKSKESNISSFKLEGNNHYEEITDKNELNVSYNLNVFGVSTVDVNGEYYQAKRTKRRRNARYLRQDSITTAINKSKRKCIDHFIIEQKSRYNSAFGMTKNLPTYLINYGIEIFFLLDIIQNFLYEYTSEEDYLPVRKFRKIAYRYIKIKKLFQLVHLRNFQNILKNFYERKFKYILKNANLKHDQKRDNNNIMRQIVTMYVIRVIRLIAILFILSYFIGTLWYIAVWQLNIYKYYEDNNNFFTYYQLDEMKDNHEDLDSMIIVVYWAFTTLSSLGYGDFYPRNNDERIIAIFVFLFGVALFTFIMNDMMEILMQYQRIKGDNNETESLTKWFGILGRFNKGMPLPKEMVKRFENFFEYYWLKDKNFAMKKLSDQRYLQELPKKIRIEIYKDFLFKDFLYLFKSYFFIKKDFSSYQKSSGPNDKLLNQLDWDDLSSPAMSIKKASLLTNVYSWRDEDYSSLMMSIMHTLQPRKFFKHDIIYDENEEVLEIVFVCSGEYAIGYMIDGREHLAIKLGHRTAIGDYQIINKQRSEFRYRALSTIDSYVLKNFQIQKIYDKHYDLCSKLNNNIFKQYLTLIRDPVIENKISQYEKIQQRYQREFPRQNIDHLEQQKHVHQLQRQQTRQQINRVQTLNLQHDLERNNLMAAMDKNIEKNHNKLKLQKDEVSIVDSLQEDYEDIKISDFQKNLGIENRQKTFERKISIKRPGTITLRRLDTGKRVSNKLVKSPKSSARFIKVNSKARRGSQFSKGGSPMNKTTTKNARLGRGQTIGGASAAISHNNDQYERVLELEQQFEYLGNAFQQVFGKYDQILQILTDTQ